MDISLKSLLASHHLSEEDINKQITDGHMEVISRSSCGKWRSLRPHLELDSIVVEDIDHMQSDECERRSKFFAIWKGKQGSRVTYKRLIRALLKIKCTQDAESVCKLLNDGDSVQQQCSGPSLNSTGTCEVICVSCLWGHDVMSEL